MEAIKLLVFRRLKKVKEAEDILLSLSELEADHSKRVMKPEEQLVCNFVKILIQLEAKNVSL